MNDLIFTYADHNVSLIQFSAEQIRSGLTDHKCSSVITAEITYIFRKIGQIDFHGALFRNVIVIIRHLIPARNIFLFCPVLLHFCQTDLHIENFPAP